MKPKFEFYEIVRITKADGNASPLAGREGVVLGRVEDENGNWFYTLDVSGSQSTWSFHEYALATTGKHAKRADYYSGKSVRVSTKRKDADRD